MIDKPTYEERRKERINNYSVRYSYKVKKEQPTYMKFLEIGLGIGLAVGAMYLVCKTGSFDPVSESLRKTQGIEQKVVE
jgi:hypothetical protein